MAARSVDHRRGAGARRSARQARSAQTSTGTAMASERSRQRASAPQRRAAARPFSPRGGATTIWRDE